MGGGQRPPGTAREPWAAPRSLRQELLGITLKPLQTFLCLSDPSRPSAHVKAVKTRRCRALGYALERRVEWRGRGSWGALPGRAFHLVSLPRANPQTLDCRAARNTRGGQVQSRHEVGNPMAQDRAVREREWELALRVADDGVGEGMSHLGPICLPTRL